MKENIKNIEASVRNRLQNKAKETNRPFGEGGSDGIKVPTPLALRGRLHVPIYGVT